MTPANHCALCGPGIRKSVRQLAIQSPANTCMALSVMFSFHGETVNQGITYAGLDARVAGMGSDPSRSSEVVN